MHSVLNWVVQGSVVALGVFLLMLLLDRSRAAMRHLLCLGALLLVLILPLVPLGQAAIGAAPLQPVAQTSPDALMTIPSTWWTSSTVVVLLCASWFVFFSRRIVRATVKVRATRLRCRPFPSSIESQLRHWNARSRTGRRASLAVSTDVGSAAILTAGPPIIAVSPALLENLRADELDRVVVHEWAHVQRRDDLVNLFQLAARALAGWHPAVWWLHRQLLIEREVACDEIVVAVTGSAKAYASSLARVASLAPAGGLSLASVGALSSSALSNRVVRILSRRRTLTPGWAAAALAAAGLALTFLSLAVAGFHPVGTARSSPPEAPSRMAPAALASDTLLDSAPQEGPVAIARPARREGSFAGSHLVAAGQPPTGSQPVDADNGAIDTPDDQSIPEPTLAARPHPMLSSTLRSPELTRQSAPAAPAATDASRQQRPGSPWAAAADAGAAIGRGSQKAGVATALFFTRIGKKIGNSF